VLLDSFGVEDMTQTQPRTIDVFCRVLSQELTRSTGHKIEIRPEFLPGYSKVPVSVSKDRKRNTSSKHNSEKQKS
jgi:hypothetical protein